MPFIGNQPALAYTSFAVQHFTTSATTSYTLDYPVANENEIRLVINNVVQQPGSSYAYTASGTSLTLSAATTGTDTMYAVFLGKAVQTVNPPNGSVGLSQLSATGTKDATTFLRGDNTFAVPAGKVLQVVSATYNTQQTTTSNSYVTSNLTVSITPSSSSNKILVFASAVIATSGTATHTGVTLYRNSTNLSTDDSMAHSYGSAGTVRCNIGVHYLDSPSTTSSTSYTIYFKAGSGAHSQYIHVDDSMSVITAIEIAG